MGAAIFDLDVQTGEISGAEHGILSALEMSLIYWARLGAPDTRIASALHLETTEIDGMLRSLASRLGLDGASAKTSLGAMNIRMSNGDWPRPSVPWADRHAATILHRINDRKAVGQDRPFASIAGEGALSLLDVADLVSRIRTGLVREGVGPGDFVALDATQRVETMLIAAAVLLQGAAIVRLGDNIQDDILRGMLGAAPSRMTFSARTETLAELPEAGRVIGLEMDGGPGVEPFVEWLDRYTASDLPDASILPTDVALVGFTSGSTGRPKRILNTHEALWRSSEVGMLVNGHGPADVFCSATDIVSMSSFRSMLTWPLMCGGQVVFLSPEGRRMPLAQALECASYNVTFLTVVPNVVRGFLHAADRFGSIPSLRAILVESGILDAATKEAFAKRFGVPVTDNYGKREMNLVLRGDPHSFLPVGVGGGRATEALIRVLDEDGRPVKDGESGELHVMTDCMARDEPGMTFGAIDGEHRGWHPTGDLGSVHHDRQVTVSGRIREIMKTADGQLLTPLEVETVLLRYPSILEASVFSVVGKDGIERVGAAVRIDGPGGEGEANAGDDALVWKLRRHVNDALDRFKTPDNILILSEFPRVAREKPDLRALRAAYLAAFDGAGSNGQRTEAPKT